MSLLDLVRAYGSMPKLRSPLAWQTGRFNKVLEELWDNVEKRVENDGLALTMIRMVKKSGSDRI